MAKKEIKAKTVGRNVILVIEGETHSKGFKTAKERKEVLAKVEAYNKRNSIAKQKELVKLMAKVTAKQKAEKKVAKKTEAKMKVVKTKKKAEKPLDTKAKEKAEKALREKEAKKSKAVTSTRRQGGEY